MKKFDPFLPLHYSPASAEDIRSLYEKYGLRRFFICGPSKSWRQIGYPDSAVYREIAEAINTLRADLKDIPVELNWWCTLTVKYGLNSPYQHITGIDGTENTIGLCPLDEEFTADTAAKFALVAKIARPPVILLEDDYSLQNQTKAVKFGCFCPLHLKAFAEKAGRYYSREELEKIFTEDRPETLPIRRLWAECAKDSLVRFAAAIRAAVDEVAPETRIGICETNNTDADGYISVEVPQALAGKNTMPLIRVRGSWYTCFDAPQRVPDYMAHTMYTAERLPEHFEFVIENDTYPHTSYFMSPAVLRTMIDHALALGADNSLLYATQYSDDMTEDPAFLNMYKNCSSRFRALQAECREGHLDGVQIVYDPLCESAKMLTRPGRVTLVHTGTMFSRMGIPHSTKYGKVKMLTGHNADVLSDAQIRELLSGGVMIDAEAAQLLCARGFSDLLGVEMKELESTLFVRERLCDLPIFETIKGRTMSNSVNAAGLNTVIPFKTPVMLEGAEMLTKFEDMYGNIVQPGIVRFTNKLGGRVCVLPCFITGNLTSNLFNLRKQEIFRRVFAWLGGEALPAVICRTPNVWLTIRRKAAETLFFITNISTAPRENIPLYLADEFRGKMVSELQNDGSWQELEVDDSSALTTVFPGVFAPVEMRVFKIKK